MIKLIIFDLSGVCFTNEEPIYLADLCKKYKYDYKEFDNFYQSLLVKAEKDEITGEQVWKEVLKRYPLPKTISQIVDEMMQLKQPHLETLNFAKELKDKIKTVYLTNYNKLYWNAISKKFRMDEWFSEGFVSYHLKDRKPAIKCFEIILQKYNLKPEEIIFLDDSKPNLENAKKLGMNTILFTNINQLKRDIDNLIHNA